MKFGVSLGADHALAERRRQERFEAASIARSVSRVGNQLDQMHVARRIEEMDAAESRTQRFRQRFGQRVDRQARRVAGNYRMYQIDTETIFV